MDGEKQKNVSREYLVPVVVGILAVAGILFGTLAFYRQILNRAGLSEAENWTTYDRHFVLIADSADADFWGDVYGVMQEAANEQGAYVERKGVGRQSEEYRLTDLMDIAIASGVDGIILQNTAERGLSGKIDEAAAAGIPVVTVMDDALTSARVSFVGVNPYAIGQVYSENLLSMIPEGEEPVRICVLLTDEATDRNQYQIYSQINTDLVTNPRTAGRVTVEAVRVSQEKPFDSEEAIHELFQQGAPYPDIVVAFSSMITDSVYQAVIDYNRAGLTQIVGYYTSTTIRNALRDGNIAMTVMPDTAGIGRNAVAALLDQINEGRTNSYYGVDIRFVTGEDLEDENP